MTEPKHTVEDIAAARRCLDAYGGDVSRWPTDARARWGATAMDAALDADRAEAAMLDALLQTQKIPPTPHDLKNKIASTYNPPAEKKDTAPLWAGLSSLSGWFRPLPAGALASLTALGFAAGAMTDMSAALSPEYEAYAYLDEDGLGALDEDAEALWDAE